MTEVHGLASKVFIVEDYARLRGMLEDLITESEGLEVCGSSASAEAALNELATVQPDLVLIDVSLPGMSGLDLLIQIRALYPNLSCVMVSGHRSVKYAAQAREAGAKAYVVKTDVDKLEGVLREVLKEGAPFYAYGLGGPTG